MPVAQFVHLVCSINLCLWSQHSVDFSRALHPLELPDPFLVQLWVVKPILELEVGSSLLVCYLAIFICIDAIKHRVDVVKTQVEILSQRQDLFSPNVPASIPVHSHKHICKLGVLALQPVHKILFGLGDCLLAVLFCDLQLRVHEFHVFVPLCWLRLGFGLVLETGYKLVPRDLAVVVGVHVLQQGCGMLVWYSVLTADLP